VGERWEEDKKVSERWEDDKKVRERWDEDDGAVEDDVDDADKVRERCALGNETKQILNILSLCNHTSRNTLDSSTL